MHICWLCEPHPHSVELAAYVNMAVPGLQTSDYTLLRLDIPLPPYFETVLEYIYGMYVQHVFPHRALFTALFVSALGHLNPE